LHDPQLDSSTQELVASDWGNSSHIGGTDRLHTFVFYDSFVLRNLIKTPPKNLGRVNMDHIYNQYLMVIMATWLKENA